MSHHKSSSDSRRHSSSSRRRSRSPHSSRNRSPGPSRSSRGDDLPRQFGRGDEPRAADDDLNILQRMKTSFANSPLACLYKCIAEKKKIKIWTRNYKEVRGILTGYLVAFDKHWNLILRDVDEVYLKPKKSKTPFLRDLEPNENLPDMPAKVPRQKRTQAEAEGESGEAIQPKAEEKAADGEVVEKKKKKKKKKKKAKNISGRRQVEKLFIRGDNIVMICPMEEEIEADDDEEEEENHKSDKSD